MAYTPLYRNATAQPEQTTHAYSQPASSPVKEVVLPDGQPGYMMSDGTYVSKAQYDANKPSRLAPDNRGAQANEAQGEAIGQGVGQAAGMAADLMAGTPGVFSTIGGEIYRKVGKEISSMGRGDAEQNAEGIGMGIMSMIPGLNLTAPVLGPVAGREGFRGAKKLLGSSKATQLFGGATTKVEDGKVRNTISRMQKAGYTDDQIMELVPGLKGMEADGSLGGFMAGRRGEARSPEEQLNDILAEGLVDPETGEPITADFAGYATNPETGEERFVNTRWLSVGGVENLEPEDTAGYSMWVEEFGPMYYQLDEETRLELNREALERGIISAEKGTMYFNKGEAYDEFMASAKPQLRKSYGDNAILVNGRESTVAELNDSFTMQQDLEHLEETANALGYDTIMEIPGIQQWQHYDEVFGQGTDPKDLSAKYGIDITHFVQDRPQVAPTETAPEPTVNLTPRAINEPTVAPTPTPQATPPTTSGVAPVTTGTPAVPAATDTQTAAMAFQAAEAEKDRALQQGIASQSLANAEAARAATAKRGLFSDLISMAGGQQQLQMQPIQMPNVSQYLNLGK